MFEILLSGRKKPLSAQWDSVSRCASVDGNTVTFSATIDPVTGEKVQYGAALGAYLPDQSCFFDMELVQGYPDACMTPGIASGEINGGNWPYTPAHPQSLVWGWDNRFRGMPINAGTNPPETTTKAGVYRFAFNKQTSMIYMRRTGPDGTSSIVGVNVKYILDNGNGRLRPLIIADWTNGPILVRLLDLQLGSGGLY